MNNSEASSPWSIDRRLLLRLFAATGYAATSFPAIAASSRGATPAAAVELLHRFQNPPASANLGAYWYWLGGNVTAEGITADLEAMQAAGITQPMLFSIGKGDKNSPIQPPADALTEHWWDLVRHAVEESERLNLTLALNCCDGWATASGPWITPELSMQNVVWSEQTVMGGRTFHGKLPQPASLNGYYKDIAVLALPFPAEWDQTSQSAQAEISSSYKLKVDDPQKITDPNNADEIVDTVEDGWIAYAFDRPFTLRSVTVRTPSPWGYSPGVYRAANSLEVQASDDGVTFHKIGSLEYPKHGWQTDLTTLTHALPETKARFFRLVHHKIPPQPYEEEYDFGEDTRLRFFSIVLSSEPRIHHVQAKNGEQWGISRETTAVDVPDAACVKRGDIVDLTSSLSADGGLVWQAPKGRWRILRIGMTTNGKMNSAAGGAQGLECDRFNADAVKLQFDSWFGKALAKMGPRYAGKTLHVLHVDSWEAGAQNWSPGFERQFQSLRGYDLMPYLAAVTGVPVDSAEASERVLFDLRRTINELTSEKFFKTISDLAHANGCVFSAEPPNPTYFCDGLEYAAYADLPMGEFWYNTPRNDKPNDVKDAVSGARVYGKPVAATESFTEGLMHWHETPYTYKALGDHIYCEGINRFMLHVYAQQPWMDRRPGMTLNGIGSFFSRTQTWWKPGKAWFSYLRRCQAMLQAGVAVSDICAFTGEHVPARALLPRNLSVAIPPGYQYDSINRDALLRLAKVENGEIVLEGGARYRVLVLPDVRTMTPQLITKLRELVLAGATIVGPVPLRSPSMEHGPDADKTVQSLAHELWGDLDGSTCTERKVGLGRVIWGMPLGAVMGSVGLAPDLKLKINAGVEWTHRRGKNWDVYFVSNQSSEALHIDATFRVEGRIPELWDPDTGTCTKMGRWKAEEGCTTIPLVLDPAGSTFVVFAEPQRRSNQVVAIESGNPEAISIVLGREGGMEASVNQSGTWHLRQRSGRTITVDEHAPLVGSSVAGPWKLRFAGYLAAPVEITQHKLQSWTELNVRELKYYSGTAVYRASFMIAAVRDARRYLLDLGDVRDLAEVRINGRSAGVLWKPPFVIDITNLVHTGSNDLEIGVTNTWNNRMIGDDGKAGADRITTVVPMLRKGQNWLPSGGDAKLLPAGLLGPVFIRPVSLHRI